MRQDDYHDVDILDELIEIGLRHPQKDRSLLLPKPKLPPIKCSLIPMSFNGMLCLRLIVADKSKQDIFSKGGFLFLKKEWFSPLDSDMLMLSAQHFTLLKLTAAHLYLKSNFEMPSETENLLEQLSNSGNLHSVESNLCVKNKVLFRKTEFSARKAHTSVTT